jgi:hypothetical protein
MKFIQNLAIAGFFSVSTIVGAATVTQLGTDLKFTYDDSTLFGEGTVVGNNIFFVPTNFRAESTNTEGSVLVSDTLNITVELIDPSSGFTMDMFDLNETGDYQVTGSGGSVTAGGSFSVTSLTNAMNEFNTFNASGLGTIGPVTEWNASSSIDLSSINGWGSDTGVILQLQNDLSATSTVQGESAFIQKKFGVVGIEINPIPVPAAVWLFSSGLLGLVGVARRKAR